MFGRCVYRLICACLMISAAAVGWAGGIPADLTELSLEELMDIEIITVSKKEERLFEAAAAVYVITQKDIRRSGVTSIPEALRLVPGFQGPRIDANKWAISSRGFYGFYSSNKLLVLIDGRNVYHPFGGGVFWEVQDVLLRDVERIEVIRGPGAALWGANAVDGVINILTKNAKDTQGGMVTLGTGSEERGFGSVRYGVGVRDDMHLRVYARYFARDDFVFDTGEVAADGWQLGRGGFRMDWEASSATSLSLQGDMYSGDVGHTFEIVDSVIPPFLRRFDFDAQVSGGNVLGRWKYAPSSASDMALQMYYDQTKRKDAVVDGVLHTFDLDFQHRFGLDARQEIVWGIGYRVAWDDIEGSFTISFDPEGRNDQLFSGFVQDEVTLVEDRLRLTFGSKFEHNEYTGVEVQPDVRLQWTPHLRHTGWAAFSRAVRTPSRIESDVRFVHSAIAAGVAYLDAPTALVIAFGTPDLTSEELLSFELGYRVRSTDRLLVDVAGFYNVYDKLRTVEPGTPFLEATPTPEHLVIPYFADDKMDAKSYGGEVEVDWRACDRWRLSATYAYLKMEVDFHETSEDVWSQTMEGASPRHQFSLRLSADLPRDVELDLGARYSDELSLLDVEGYVTLDARVGWSPRPGLEVSLVGQNLLEKHHPEFKPLFSFTVPTEVERGVYGSVTWRF